MLREVKALGDAAVTVLGNHDFHLLTVAAGHTKPHRQDTIAPILEAPDRDELLRLAARAGRWSSSRASLLLVHAGLLPAWTPATALALSARGRGDARERARRRISCARSTATSRARGATISKASTGCASIVNACTRMRFCTADGTMEFKEKRGPQHGAAPAFARGSSTSTARPPA